MFDPLRQLIYERDYVSYSTGGWTWYYDRSLQRWVAWKADKFLVDKCQKGLMRRMVQTLERKPVDGVRAQV